MVRYCGGMEIIQSCWIAADREQRTVKSVELFGYDIPSALKEVGGADHTSFTRKPYYDANGLLCFVSNLGHVFMVSI